MSLIASPLRSPRFADDNPDIAEWQRILFVSHTRIGNMLVAAGDRAAALAAYRKALGIIERLTDDDPDNPTWQRGLTFGYNKIGDMTAEAGDREAALVAYRKALAIAERFVAADPGNADWQQELGISHDRIGDMMVAAGDRETALLSYRKSFAISHRLLAADLSNDEWERDVAVTLIKITQITGEDPSTAFFSESIRTLNYPYIVMDADKANIIKAAADLLSTVYPAYDVRKALEDLAANAARETTGRATTMARAASRRARREARAGSRHQDWQPPSVRLPNGLKWPTEQFNSSPEYKKKGGITRHLERVWKPLIAARAVDMSLLRLFYPSTARAIDSFKYNDGGDRRELRRDLDIPLLKAGSGRHSRSSPAPGPGRHSSPAPKP